MDIAYCKKWAGELRANQHRQIISRMADKDESGALKYCAAGCLMNLVSVELYGIEYPNTIGRLGEAQARAMTIAGSLWQSAILLNDSGRSFAQLADIIEADIAKREARELVIDDLMK
jgi:hypothetical protein